MGSTSNGGHLHPEQPAEQPERSSPTRRVAADHSDIELVGRSQAFIEVMKQVDSVANINLPVLLIGEPGTGRELVASAIHQRSDRHDQPFLVVNCGASPRSCLSQSCLETVGSTRVMRRSRRRHYLSRRDHGNNLVIPGPLITRTANGRDQARGFERVKESKCACDCRLQSETGSKRLQREDFGANFFRH